AHDEDERRAQAGRGQQRAQRHAHSIGRRGPPLRRGGEDRRGEFGVRHAFLGYPSFPRTPRISSRMAGSSMVGGTRTSWPSAIRRIVPRRILPDRVFGNLFTTAAVLKNATGPMRSRTRSTSSRTTCSSGLFTPAL